MRQMAQKEQNQVGRLHEKIPKEEKAMKKMHSGGSEKMMSQKRKMVTEAGLPEYARTMREYSDPHQIIKTAMTLRNPRPKK